MVNRHARLPCALSPALPIFPLPVSMIGPSCRTLLVAAIGATPLTEPGLVAAGQAAIAMSAITVGTEKKDRAAFAAQTNSQPKNHLALKRHACSQAGLDKSSPFVAG
jgi:hypothetical protein